MIRDDAYLEIGGSHHVIVAAYTDTDVQPSHLGNTFFFWKANGAISNQNVTLWKTDGTVAGTSQVSSTIFNSGNLEEFDNGITFNGYYYFMGDNGTTTFSHLYRTDGNTVETVKQFPTNTFATGTKRMGTVFKNKLYFAANVEITYPNTNVVYETELMESEGTSAGTKVLKNFRAGDDLEYFQANDRICFKKSDNLMLIKTWENTCTVYYTDGTV